MLQGVWKEGFIQGFWKRRFGIRCGEKDLVQGVEKDILVQGMRYRGGERSPVQDVGKEGLVQGMWN